jgi:prepilin peptidase CpaA
MTPEVLVALGIGVAASGEDIWRRNISNWIPLAGLVCGLVLQVAKQGWLGLAYWAGGAVAGFCVFLLFYMLGGMGGGDVKLMAGFGAVLGPVRLLEAALWTAGIGGIMAAAAVCFYEIRKLYRRAHARAAADKTDSGDRTGGGRMVGGPVGAAAYAKDDAYIPYAPAITLGAWVAMIPKGV